MPRASHVRWPQMKLDYGFLFDIRSNEELLDYQMAVYKNKVQEGFSNYVNSEYYVKGGVHLHTDMGRVLADLGLLESLRENPRSIVEVLSDFENHVFTCMKKIILEHGGIFINGRGGYFALNSEQEIVETIELEKFILPSARIRIIQWPHGLHYYAKIGDEDVVVDGEQKWSTEKAARDAAIKYQKGEEK